MKNLRYLFLLVVIVLALQSCDVSEIAKAQMAVAAQGYTNVIYAREDLLGFACEGYGGGEGYIFLATDMSGNEVRVIVCGNETNGFWIRVLDW